MNKPLYLGLLILKIKKIVACEFWFDYVKPKQGDKTKLYYIDTDSFTAHIKTENIYIYIPKYVEARFDTSNYKLDRPLSKIKKKKVFGLMKDEQEEKIMREFSELTPRTYIYLINDGDENKKEKSKTKYVIKQNLHFENNKHC